MDLGRVDVVLVRPARAANLAASCRALKNMGLASLRLVEPAAMVSEAERGLAWRAWDVLERAERYPDLASAVADAAFVCGASGQPGPAWTPRELAGAARRRSGGGRLALVFGPEADGLSREELRLCHEWVRVPSDPEQPSLNLAQAVLLIAYELRLAAEPDAPDEPVAALPQPAPAEQLEAALGSLRRGLLGIGYLNRENPEALLGELRRLLARAGPTRREVALLRGLGRQLEWAASRIAEGPR